MKPIITLQQKLVLIKEILEGKKVILISFYSNPSEGDTIVVGNMKAVFKDIKITKGQTPVRAEGTELILGNMQKIINEKLNNRTMNKRYVLQQEKAGNFCKSVD